MGKHIAPQSLENDVVPEENRVHVAKPLSIETTNSAAAEIANSNAPPDPVGDAIARCEGVANGESVFKLSNAQIYVALAEAYRTFDLIHDDEVRHQRVIDALMAYGNRERRPSLKKAALNAVVLACHPDNPEAWTLCSDWANVVVLASIEKLPPEDFPDWVKNKTIRESKQKVRAVKKAAKPLKLPLKEGDFPGLTQVFKYLDDESVRQKTLAELKALDAAIHATLSEVRRA